jgi:hypothetical protein
MDMDMGVGEHHDHLWNMEKEKIYSTGTFGWSPTLVLTELDPA